MKASETALAFVFVPELAGWLAESSIGYEFGVIEWEVCPLTNKAEYIYIYICLYPATILGMEIHDSSCDSLRPWYGMWEICLGKEGQDDLIKKRRV